MNVSIKGIKLTERERNKFRSFFRQATRNHTDLASQTIHIWQLINTVGAPRESQKNKTMCEHVAVF